MRRYTHRIHDVLKRPYVVLSKVKNNSYLTNKKEPAETISEMSPNVYHYQKGEEKSLARQRRGIRKIALRLRIRNKK